MTAPLMMRFKRKDREMVINMNHVAHIMPNGTDGLVLTFAAGFINDEPAYLIVDETLDSLGKRSEWNNV